MYQGLIFSAARELSEETRQRLRLHNQMFALSWRQVRLGGGRGMIIEPLVILVESDKYLDPVKDLWEQAAPLLAPCFNPRSKPLKVATIKWSDL